MRVPINESDDYYACQRAVDTLSQRIHQFRVRSSLQAHKQFLTAEIYLSSNDVRDVEALLRQFCEMRRILFEQWIEGKPKPQKLKEKSTKKRKESK